MQSTQTIGENKELLLNGVWIRPATVVDLVLISIRVFSRILPASIKQYKHGFYQILLKDR